MIGAVLLAHLVGDYLIQSDWMAIEKTKRWWPAILHGVTYTLPFLFITTEWQALAVIAGTHVVIDRFRLARYFVWARNWFSPLGVEWRGRWWPHLILDPYNPAWVDCKATGFPPGRPIWLATWLMIIADNTIHLLINVVSVRWLG